MASQVNQLISSPNTTYSSTVKKTPKKTFTVKNPKKEDAIVFPIVDNLTNEDYIKALLEFVKPETIHFASRMSNARLCVYLDSRESVDKFMDHGGHIKVQNQKIQARKLVNPSKKLLLSNVCPIIPNEVLTTALTETLKLNLTSPIIYLNAGLSDPSLQHILSFRRSVYYSCTETTDQQIPESILIKINDEEYRIFLSTEQKLVCFLCKETGHLAKTCSLQQEDRKQSEEAPVLNQTQPSPKRRAPSSTSSITPENALDSPPIPSAGQSNSLTVANKQNNKKLKTEKNTKQKTPAQLHPEEKDKITIQLEAIRSTNTLNCPYSAEEFINFIDKLRNTREKLQLAKDFTRDLKNLSLIIDEIKPLVLASTKRSLTIFQKSLVAQHNISESESDT